MIEKTFCHASGISEDTEKVLWENEIDSWDKFLERMPEIDYLPESGAFALPDNKAIFRYAINETANGKIQLVVNEGINVAVLSAGYYTSLKDYFNELVNKENDKIVLIKK